MSETVIVAEHSENLYSKLGTAFLQVVMLELNRALRESGINDANVRKEICSRFGYGLGNFIDQYWIEVEGKKYYPIVCFSKEII